MTQIRSESFFEEAVRAPGSMRSFSRMPKRPDFSKLFNVEFHEFLDGEEPRPVPVRSRVSKQFIRPATADPHVLGNVVLQTSSSTTSFLSVADNRGANLTSTITSVSGAMFLPQVFIVPYLNSVSSTFKWPSGSFFDATTAERTAANYDLATYYDNNSSSTGTVVYRARLNNHTGAAVTIGWTVRVRFIINAGGST